MASFAALSWMLADFWYMVQEVIVGLFVSSWAEIKRTALSLNWTFDKDTKPKDVLILGAIAYWTYLIVSYTYKWLGPKGKKGSKAKAGGAGKEKSEEETTPAFRLPERVGSKTKQTKKRKGKGFFGGDLMGSLYSFGLSFLMYYGTKNMYDGSFEYGRILISGYLREGATKLVYTLLPKPKWQKESLWSWLRLFLCAVPVFFIFRWIMEVGEDVLIKSAAASVLFEIVKVTLKMLRLDDLQQVVPKIAFVLMWKFVFNEMNAYVIFGMMISFELSQDLAKWASKKVRKPYSIFLPLLFRIPVLVPIFFGVPLFFTKWNKKAIARLHKNETVTRFKWIWGLSARKSYYEILGIPEYSNTTVVKKAFKEHSLRLHPDKNPDPKARQLFLKVKDAYNNLVKKGNEESMRMKQFETNKKDLQFCFNVLTNGFSYVIGFPFVALSTLYQFLMYFRTVEKSLRVNQAKSLYLEEEWKLLMQSQAAIELYIRSGRNRVIQEQATKWLHPLKRAIAFKSKNSFKGDFPEDTFKDALKKEKSDLFSEQEGDLRGLERLERVTVNLVTFGLLHRLVHLLHKRTLATNYLEGNKKDADELDGQLKDLNDLIATHIEELDSFGQALDIALDFTGIESDSQSAGTAIRYYFRKELKESKKDLTWMKSMLSAPWHEYKLFLYNPSIPRYV